MFQLLFSNSMVQTDFDFSNISQVFSMKTTSLSVLIHILQHSPLDTRKVCPTRLYGPVVQTVELLGGDTFLLDAGAQSDKTREVD